MWAALLCVLLCFSFVLSDSLKQRFSHQQNDKKLGKSLSLSRINSGVAKSSTNITHVAICLTGQLIRLELGSKIENLITTNLERGLHISLFVLLDNDISHGKFTKSERSSSRFAIEDNPYINITSDGLSDSIRKQVPPMYESVDRFRVYTRLEAPQRMEHVLTSDKSPVHDFEGSTRRFQHHMRWQGGLRECVKWMQATEVENRKHFDFVMRLREDTYVISKFYMFIRGYRNRIITLKEDNFGGLNDHDIIIDRKYADTMFRGLVEDYYFQEARNSSHGVQWGNPESLLKRMANYYSIDSAEKSICLFPFMPINGHLNASHFSFYDSSFLKEPLPRYFEVDPRSALVVSSGARLFWLFCNKCDGHHLRSNHPLCREKLCAGSKEECRTKYFHAPKIGLDLMNMK